jgi:hypothetical protein
LSFTVHNPPTLQVQQRTLNGRLKMLLVMLVCAAPVVASYFTYFVIRPEGRTNYSELVDPQRPLPDLPLADLQGKPFTASRLRGQWLLVVVGHGACNAGCERQLYIQRQLREALGREKERLDKVWFITDGQPPRPEVLNAITAGMPATVLQVPRQALAGWLSPAAGHALEDHLYIVDPMGNWMMRVPADADAKKLKRDLDRLLRGSASWDTPGR